MPWLYSLAFEMRKLRLTVIPNGTSDLTLLPVEVIKHQEPPLGA
jgi:hypothetical protein